MLLEVLTVLGFGLAEDSILVLVLVQAESSNRNERPGRRPTTKGKTQSVQLQSEARIGLRSRP